MSSEDRFKWKEWQFHLKGEIKRVDRELKRLDAEQAATWKQLALLARKRAGADTIQTLAGSAAQAQAAALRLQRARASLHALDLLLTEARAALGRSSWTQLPPEVQRELEKLARFQEVTLPQELRSEVPLAPDNNDEGGPDDNADALAEVQRRLEELRLDHLGPLTLPVHQPEEEAQQSTTPQEPQQPLLQPAEPPRKRSRGWLVGSLVCAVLLLGAVHCAPLLGERLGAEVARPEAVPEGPRGSRPLAAVRPEEPIEGSTTRRRQPAARHKEVLTTHPPPVQREELRAGVYDLRVMRGGKLVGCASPTSRFPSEAKYACAGAFGTPADCDAAAHPVRSTKYVSAVRRGCQASHSVYAYAFDDVAGLRSCASSARYEWVLCPRGDEGGVGWAVEPGPANSTRRFRVTNRCEQELWIQQVGALLPHEPFVRHLEPNTSHSYAIPDRGLPSATFVAKKGCDSSGTNCDVQTSSPCPPGGCMPGIDSRFGASWGCMYAREGGEGCSRTEQGKISTYNDWWDGSVVKGWTLPFSILVDESSHSETCSDVLRSVLCAELDAESLCPRDEFLTPTS